MKKVVINTCYGGFGLSIEAKKRIDEVGCPHTKRIPENEYFKDRVADAVEEYRQHLELWGIAMVEGEVIIDEHWDVYGYGSPEIRACPVLAKVVEEMGKEANGPHAELKVVEIPDDVEYVIQEYDGLEWVAEKHRTWGRD